MRLDEITQRLEVSQILRTAAGRMIRLSGTCICGVPFMSEPYRQRLNAEHDTRCIAKQVEQLADRLVSEIRADGKVE